MFAKRVKVLLRLAIAAFLVLWVRLGWLQIVCCQKYRGQSRRHAIKRVTLEAFRGTIRDRRGTPLAVDKPCFHLVVKYKLLRQRASKARGNTRRADWLGQAAEITHLDPKQLQAAADHVLARVQAVKQRIFDKTGKRLLIREEVMAHPIARDIGIEALARYRLHRDRYPDVEVQTTSSRHYPQGDLACHLIGYMQTVTRQDLQRYGREYDGLVEKRYLPNDTIGRTGAERTYNRYLRGCRGERIETVSTEGRRLTRKTLLVKPAVAGHDVYLTIDANIQRAAERALGSHKGAIVVLRPNTGEILALASSPRYDLRTFRKHYAELARDTENAPLLNRAVCGLLPPGSVFKVVSAATALSCHKLQPSDTFLCTGSIRVGSIRLRCWARYGHGALNLHDALVHSCNVYFYEVAHRLTNKELLAGARRFGFGSRVSMDIGAEASKPLPRLFGVADRMNVAVGQGSLMVTPLQVATMIATIANDGVLVRPHLTRRVVSQDKRIVAIGSNGKPKRVVSAEISRTIKKALVDVVLRGTARGHGLDRFKVACKTGTAQTQREDVNHAWLAGFAPYDDPKVAFAVVAEKVAGHGGEVAGPIVEKMLAEIMPALLASASRPESDVGL